ncbi:MAG TPA: glycosyltransferase family 2 protein [Chloroflexota bacterium]|nr:glycosyltransferase family 2 protein [Chloroflexota bacterium]
MSSVSSDRPDHHGDRERPAISVVIPVYNSAPMLQRCLEGLWQSRGVAWECIVVDDGCTDESVAVAREWGAQVVRTEQPRSGPGRARNLGAQAASAPLLCFVDADVVVRPDTLAQFVMLFASDPQLAAAFGSYDDRPAAPDLLSQYRNLLHHFVHQSGREAASTFWAGCGAIKRSVFLTLGGFDPSYARPSIEDIELGYRLRAGGERIRLAKHIQVTHLKRWTLRGIVTTDIRDRALPWTELIVRSRSLPNDLNLDAGSRVSALGVYGLVALVALGWWLPVAWLGALVTVGVLLACNWGLYAFFLRQRGFWFLLRVIPIHWLYYGYSALAFAGGIAYGSLKFRRPGAIPTSDLPLVPIVDRVGPPTRPEEPAPAEASAAAGPQRAATRRPRARAGRNRDESLQRNPKP